MSSIPLPALDIRPPQQQESPVEQYGKIMQLKSLMQGQQLQQGQMQLQNQQIQEGQMSLNDRKVIMEAYKQANGDLDKTISLASQNGISNPQTLIGLKKASVDQQMQNIALFKAKGEQAVQEANLMQGAHDTVAKAPADQRPQVYQQQLQALGQAGIDISKVPPQYPGDEAFSVMGLGLTDHKTQMENLAKEAETQKNTAQAREASASADLSEQKATQMKQFGGLSPEMIESKYAFLDAQKAQGKKIAPADEAWMKGIADYKKIVPVANFNLQNALPQGQNGQPSAMAQAVANGTMKWQDVISPRTPMSVKAAFAKEVNAINPDFNTQTYEISKKVTESFTSGDYSKQLNAINTARNHMQTFSQLADALNNGDVQAANKIGNAFGVQFGSDKATNFKIASQAFGGEVGKAFDGAGVTQSERESAAQAFNPNMSPQQFQGAVKTVDNLLQGKQNALKQTFDKGRKAQPNFGSQQGGTIRARDPQGKLHEAPAGTALPQGWTKE